MGEEMLSVRIRLTRLARSILMGRRRKKRRLDYRFHKTSAPLEGELSDKRHLRVAFLKEKQP